MEEAAVGKLVMSKSMRQSMDWKKQRVDFMGMDYGFLVMLKRESDTFSLEVYKERLNKKD